MKGKSPMNFARWFLVAFLGVAAVPASAADVANGHLLYDNFCRVCHGFPPLGGPELAAGNPALITSAINGLVPAMAVLRGVVTGPDVADIAAYLASLSAPAPPPPGPVVPAFNTTDLWWNPQESGWGINIVQSPTSNNIFAVMFTYESSTKETWFILPGGTWVSPTLFTGAWYAVSGPPPNMTFKPNQTTAVGTGTIAFSDASHATLTFSVNGVTTTKTMVRLDF
jgi:hypothetical protein